MIAGRIGLAQTNPDATHVIMIKRKDSVFGHDLHRA